MRASAGEPKGTAATVGEAVTVSAGECAIAAAGDAGTLTAGEKAIAATGEAVTVTAGEYAIAGRGEAAVDTPDEVKRASAGEAAAASVCKKTLAEAGDAAGAEGVAFAALGVKLSAVKWPASGGLATTVAGTLGADVLPGLPGVIASFGAAEDA